MTRKYYKVCAFLCGCIILSGFFYFLAIRPYEPEKIGFEISKAYHGWGGYILAAVERKVIWDVPLSNGNIEVDGVIAPKEWSEAKKYEYTYKYGDILYTLYLQHDSTYLYLLLIFDDASERYFYFFFGSSVPITNHTYTRLNTTNTYTFEYVFGGETGFFVTEFGNNITPIGDVHSCEILIKWNYSKPPLSWKYRNSVEVRIPLKYLPGFEHEFNILGVPSFPCRTSGVFYSLGGKGSVLRFLPWNNFLLMFFSIVVPSIILLVCAIWLKLTPCFEPEEKVNKKRKAYEELKRKWEMEEKREGKIAKNK